MRTVADTLYEASCTILMITFWACLYYRCYQSNPGAANALIFVVVMIALETIKNNTRRTP